MSSYSSLLIYSPGNTGATGVVVPGMDEHTALLLKALAAYPNLQRCSPKQLAGKLHAFRGKQPETHEWVQIIRQAQRDGLVEIVGCKVRLPR